MADEPWEELLERYMNGELDDEQRRLFMHCLRVSDEASDALASAIATERLLEASGKPAVPVADIMSAVMKDEPHPRPEPSAAHAPPPPSRAGQHWPIGLAAVVVLGLAYGASRVFKKPPGPGPAPLPAKVEPAPAPVAQVPKGGPPSDTLDPSDPSDGSDSTGQPDPPAPSTYAQAFPAEPPAVADAPPDPVGKGEDQPGFVALPAQIEPRVPQTTPDPFGPVPPTLVAKINVGADATPNDLLRLLTYVAREHRLQSRFRDVYKSELQDDPSETPLLYLSSHHHVVFSPEQRATLRRYILNGGMVIFNAGGGSLPALASARRELGQIFPELSLQRLSADHPLYHAYFDLDTPPAIEGLTLSCRTAVLVFPEGIAQAWQARDPAALQFGVNLFSYATAVRAWAKRTQHTRSFAGVGATQGDKLFVAQVEHGGEWRTRYTGLPNLLHTYNQRTEVPVQFDIKSLPLTDGDIFNHPLLYLTGHEPLRLKAAEIMALRRYLENGGFLMAEACCGRTGFDRSFRALMKQVFPRQPLEVVPANSPLFQQPNRIELLGVTQKLGARTGSMLMRPRLEGIKFGEHYGVVYSPYGIAGGWEMSQTPYADGYEDPDTLKLGQNILHYAITQ